MAGSSVPDRLRPSFQHPARALAEQLRDHAPTLVWHALHPSRRESFRESSLLAVDRLYWSADDGWSGSIQYVPPCPGGSGEPVVLLHTLGLGADAFRVGRARSLVGLLSAAGHGVYLPALRGDREATGPAGSAFRPDDVSEFDVPAILTAVRAHGQAARPLIIGHGTGGLALAGHLARRGDQDLAAVVMLSVPVRFPGLDAATRLGMRIAAGAGLDLPMRAAARLAAVFGDPEQRVRGATMRTALIDATEDVPVAWLHTLERWCAAGSLVDRSGTRELALALRGVRVPLLVATSTGDTWCPPDRAEALLRLWGGRTEHLALEGDLGHLDLLLHPSASSLVSEPIVRWLNQHRRESWGAGPGAPAVEVRGG
jgi:pimeloyl-ACP methyl ester carboxylesterase